MFKVYALAYQIQDDYNEGEIGKHYDTVMPDVYGRGKTVEEALDNAFTNLGIDTDWRNNLSLENDESNILIFCQMELAHGRTLTAEEIEQWKNGEIKAYAAYYRFNVKEENDVPIDVLNKLDLARY